MEEFVGIYSSREESDEIVSTPVDVSRKSGRYLIYGLLRTSNFYDLCCSLCSVTAL